MLHRITSFEISRRLPHWERTEEDGAAVFRNNGASELRLYERYAAQVHCISMTGGADFMITGEPDEFIYSICGPGDPAPSMYEPGASIGEVVDLFVARLEAAGAIPASRKRKFREE